ncbi:serine/threonine-protein kinase [Streptomyces sp. NBC_01268]|uniref:serine/threonine-protein kinase n=1 Tax=Streptomyces sp. NBC_01268 TaxID=2903806 RepID=UPI002E3264E1|nr:serine/threonine-protein kinase [Streptomyces sp. NBC_01268]
MSTSEDGRALIDGRFRLLSRLGSGGMGTVWRARDTALDRVVALKEVRPPDPAAEEAQPGLAAQMRERAVREAQALARLSHPHVVTIHHIVEPRDGSHPWIVMELVEGRSVHERLDEGPMPVPEVLALGRQVLSALRAAHAAGIQHRDVKPANVLLRRDGSAVLTDFGIAALDEATTRLTASGDLIGSADFIAPERVRGEEGNPASDLWSLGMLLYVAAEGHHPLRRATSLATVVAVLNDPIPHPVRSGALAPVLARLLVRDPALRPGGAELERLLADAEAGAPAVPGPAAGAFGPPPGAFGPADAHPAYAHPAYGPPTPAAAPRAPLASRRRAVLVAVSIVLAVAAVGVVVDKGGLLDLGGSGNGGGKGGATPWWTPAPDTAGTATGTAETQGGTLLTPANVRAVIEAFRKAGGSTTMKELTIHEEYALASIPTRPGAKTYDRYEFRDGVARKTGPGGTLYGGAAADDPFDVSAMAWDDLPALMKRGERELKVERPTLRYVVIDRWTFNDDRPTLRYYLINEYNAVGYFVVDSSGKVVASHPTS